MSKEREPEFIQSTPAELRAMCATMERIRSKCEEAGDCWLWRGSMNGSGRTPCITYQGKTQNVRRVVYAIKHGKVRAGRVVSPGCGEYFCVSPACVKQVTISQARKIASKARGAYSSPAKVMKTAMARRRKSHISEEMVRAIRESSAATRQIARDTGISRSHIQAIREGRARADFTNPFTGMFSGLLAVNEPAARAA